MYDPNLPSAFNSDLISDSAADAPSFITRITAHVLGALIASQSIAYDDQPGETIERLDRVIAEAIDRVIDDLDMIELTRAHETRFNARRAARELSK